VIQVSNSRDSSEVSEPSETITLYMIPGAPVITRTNKEDRNAISITWVDGPSDGGSIITRYIVSYKKVSDAQVTIIDENIRERKFTKQVDFNPNLGDEYIFYVVAVNDEF